MLYSIDYINNLESFQINENDAKWKDFLIFIKKYETEATKEYILPLYLQNRYGNACITRSTLKKKKKLFSDTGHINEEIGKILSKLSKSNKDVIFKDFFKLNLKDENLEEIAKYIYERGVELTYLSSLYSELITLISRENTELFIEIIDILIRKLINPEVFTDKERTKKFMKGNAILVGELLHRLKSEVPFNISNIINILKDKSMTESILLILKTSQDVPLIKTQEDYLNSVYLSGKEIEENLRYIALDILELLE